MNYERNIDSGRKRKATNIDDQNIVSVAINARTIPAKTNQKLSKYEYFTATYSQQITRSWILLAFSSEKTVYVYY